MLHAGMCISMLTHTLPATPLQDIESGVGAVHNTLLFDHPQKSVLYGPWRYKPKPFWLVDNLAVGENYLVPYVIRFAQVGSSK